MAFKDLERLPINRCFRTLPLLQSYPKEPDGIRSGTLKALYNY
ncbi:hypothetical protein B932_2639 [Gluconobacter oxydans H24]|nr:hypothetical protein B932_2639 [Gluconobacter oxydans H24]